MAGRFKPPCRGRTRRTCRKAPKSCRYVSGTRRHYCRKSMKRRRSR